MKTFSGKEAMLFGWEEFKKNPWVYVGIGVIIGILNGISNIDSDNILMILIGAAAYIIGVLATIGYMKISLGVIDGKKPKIEDLFKNTLKEGRLFVKYILAGLLIGLMAAIPLVIIGIILFASGMITTLASSDTMSGVVILVGLIAIILLVAFLIRFIFVTYLIVDKRVKFWDTFKVSSQMTKGHRSKIVYFFLAMLVLNLLGLIALVVGLLVTMAISQLATAYVYRKLLPDALKPSHVVTTTETVTETITETADSVVVEKETTITTETTN
jgi:hypothetical protein